MTTEELHLKYDHLVSITATMLRKQREYFDGKKRGYTEPHKLRASMEAENVVKAKVREMHADSNQPDVFADDLSRELYKSYTHFLSRLIVLLTAQHKYFQNTTDHKQLAKCKSLEHEIEKLIKTKNSQAKQQTLY